MITKLRKQSALMLEYVGRMPLIPPEESSHKDILAGRVAWHQWRTEMTRDARSLAAAAQFLKDRRLSARPPLAVVRWMRGHLDGVRG